MGDMGELFNAFKEHEKERKAKNLLAAHQVDDGGWIKHTDYHWSRQLNGKKLDYWPSRNKFQYNSNIMCGDVMGFIRKRNYPTTPKE